MFSHIQLQKILENSNCEPAFAKPQIQRWLTLVTIILVYKVFTWGIKWFWSSTRLGFVKSFTTTSKYWLPGNIVTIFQHHSLHPSFSLSPLSPQFHSAEPGLCCGLGHHLTVGHSLSMLEALHYNFFPLLDTCKSWPLSTAWHSSVIRLLTSSMHQSSQKSHTGTVFHCPKCDWWFPCALALCIMLKSISSTIHLWKWGSLDYPAMALEQKVINLITTGQELSMWVSLWSTP